MFVPAVTLMVPSPQLAAEQSASQVPSLVSAVFVSSTYARVAEQAQ